MKTILVSLLVGTAAIGFMTSTYAADLIVEEPVEVGVVDVSGSWDGIYVGAFAGYGWGEVSDPNNYYDFSDSGQVIDLSGFLAGVTLGANFTVGSGIVAGVVGDIAWSGIAGESIDYYNDIIIEHDINWVASLRGRLGFDGGAFLPYLTAGLAIANATSLPDNDDSYTDTQTHVGWTVGAGVEFAVSEDLSVDLLYRYSDYGTKVYSAWYSDDEFGLTSHTVQVGLNWSF